MSGREDEGEYLLFIWYATCRGDSRGDELNRKDAKDAEENKQEAAKRAKTTFEPATFASFAFFCSGRPPWFGGSVRSPL